MCVYRYILIYLYTYMNCANRFLKLTRNVRVVEGSAPFRAEAAVPNEYSDPEISMKNHPKRIYCFLRAWLVIFLAE